MSRRISGSVALVLALVVAVLATWMHWPWWLAVIGMVGLAGFALLEWYEQFAVDPKRIALVATLSAVSAVGRTVVQGIPGVQPATFLVILSGFTLGPATGAAVGVFTAVGSDFFLGEGGWTPWHVLAWGLCGLTAGLIRPLLRRYRPWMMTLFGCAWGYVFGWIMNTWLLLGGATLGWHAYVLLCVASFWFDTLHAAATGALCLIAGHAVYHLLERYRQRMEVSRINVRGHG